MSTVTEEKPAVVRRAPKRASEFDSRSVKIEQKETLTMKPLHETQEHPEQIQKIDLPMKDLKFDAIAFAEEPIKMIIHRHPDPKFSPMCTDYIAVQGVPAEMLFKNGWIRVGYLPRGIEFYTKRKYVEVIARAKYDTINTEVIERDNEDPVNKLHTVTTANLAFTILEDKNPKSAEWLSLLIRSQF